MTDQSLKKSSLFLLELIIVLLFFSFCIAICVNIFVDAKVLSTQSYDLNNSVLTAQNGAECFKATNGNAKEIASLLGGVQKNNIVSVTYDENWNAVKTNNYTYQLTITISQSQANISSAEISVTKDTDILYSLKASTFIDIAAGD